MAATVHVDLVEESASTAGRPPRDLIGLDETCALLRCSLPVLEKIITSGKLRTFVSSFGGLAFRRKQVHALFQPTDVATACQGCRAAQWPTGDEDGFRYYRAVAKQLRVNPEWIRKLASTGKIPSKIANHKSDPKRKIWWVHPRDVQSYQHKNKRTGHISDRDAFAFAERQLMTAGQRPAHGKTSPSITKG